VSRIFRWSTRLRRERIFIGAVTRMSFDDARQILSGSDTAATDYFKRQSSAELIAAFAPIVHDAIENVGSANRDPGELHVKRIAQCFARF